MANLDPAVTVTAHDESVVARPHAEKRPAFVPGWTGSSMGGVRLQFVVENYAKKTMIHNVEVMAIDEIRTRRRLPTNATSE